MSIRANSPFDREAALTAWRSRVAAQEALGSENIDELEAHLLDQASDLEERGLSGDEAWLIAERRLGLPETLGEEFGRADPGCVASHRIVWAITGALTLQILLAGVAVLSLVISQVYLALYDAQYDRFAGGSLDMTSSAVLHGLAMGALLCGGVYVSYRAWFANRWELWSERLSKLARRPFVLLTLVLAAMGSAALLNWGAMVMASRQYSLDSFGAVALARSFANAIWGVALPVFLVLALSRVRRAAPRDCSTTTSTTTT